MLTDSFNCNSKKRRNDLQGTHNILFIGFEVLMTVRMKMAVFWVVTLCSLVEIYQHFRGTCWLHHQGPDDGGSKYLWNVSKLSRIWGSHSGEFEAVRQQSSLVNFYQTTWHYNPEDNHHQYFDPLYWNYFHENYKRNPVIFCSFLKSFVLMSRLFSVVFYGILEDHMTEFCGLAFMWHAVQSILETPIKSMILWIQLLKRRELTTNIYKKYLKYYCTVLIVINHSQYFFLSLFSLYPVISHYIYYSFSLWNEWLIYGLIFCIGGYLLRMLVQSICVQILPLI
jgi:hypothetical protein